MASTSYILGIDGLRALSVIAVMVYHLTGTGLPGGFTGVDVFFVISGYVVAGSLFREREKTFGRFLSDFYARRLLRLYPALVACGLAVTFFSVLFIPRSWLSQALNKTALFAFFGLSNFALILFNDGYFSPRVDFNPFTHTWSLAVEEQFYLLFPLLFFLVLRVPWLKTLLAVGAVASLFVAQAQMVSNPDWAFYLLPGRFWELAAGALLFLLHTKDRGFPRGMFMRSATLGMGLAAIAAGFFYCLPKGMPFPWALLPVVGALLCLNALVGESPAKPVPMPILESAPLVYLGKLSYSLYLWHWPVFVLFRWTIGLDTEGQRFAALVIATALSVVSYHFIESPLRRAPALLAWPSKKLIPAAVTVIGLFAGAAALLLHNQQTLSLSVTRDYDNWYPRAFPERSTFVGQKRFTGRKIFALGDSHVGAYGTLFEKLVEEDGVEAIRFEQFGCTILDLMEPLRASCVPFVERTIEQILSQAHPGDVVFFAALRMPRTSGNWSIPNEWELNEKYAQIERDRASVVAEASPIVARLLAAHLHVVFEAPKPVLPAPPFRCSDAFNRNNSICRKGLSIPFEAFEKASEPIRQTLKKVQEQNPKLLVWDPALILCGKKECSAFQEDKPLFFDGDHLTGYANLLLYPSFKAELTRLWRD